VGQRAREEVEDKGNKVCVSRANYTYGHTLAASKYYSMYVYTSVVVYEKPYLSKSRLLYDYI
jgi:hypothetical protein